ncbi:MAG: PEP-CTERM sorting domain-containing protein [Planctomycetes bacterium]|nr:PEP-CTERM sorting domain-containing protein [Planctomycetota bacterium]
MGGAAALKRLIGGLVLFLALAVGGFAAAAEQPFRVYFIGNSITDVIHYAELQKLAESRGHSMIWGRDMIPGAPLSWLWQHPKDGFQEVPFGLYPKALRDYSWNALSLEPFDRHLDGAEGDLAMAGNFIHLALAKSPEVQVYIYSRWPRRDPGPGGKLVLDYPAKWLRPYTGRNDGSEESRDYFERLVHELRKANPKMAHPVLLVPVGDVLLELDRRMKAGKVPGFTDIAQVYADGIHFNNVGSYIVGVTYFATLFQEDPRGLTFEPYNTRRDPNKDRALNQPLAAVIQEVVWEVVRKHPLATIRH